MNLNRRKQEALKPYKTLYKGRRLWAVLNSPKRSDGKPDVFWHAGIVEALAGSGTQR